DVDVDAGEEDVVREVVDDDVADPGAELADHGLEQVVRLWARDGDVLQLDDDRVGLVVADPDRQIPIRALLLEDPDALIGLEVDPYGLHAHLDQHGPALPHGRRGQPAELFEYRDGLLDASR